jgi:hypothetical protein
MKELTSRDYFGPVRKDYFDPVRMISDVFGEGRTIQVKNVISKRYSTIRRPGYGQLDIITAPCTV